MSVHHMRSLHCFPLSPLRCTRACSLEHPSPALIRKHGGGAHGFSGLQGRLLIASARDPVQYSVQRWKNRVSDSVRVVTHGGHQDLSLDRQGLPCYMT